MTAILFDLDGTLVNSAPGISATFQHVLKSMGYEAPPSSELGWTIGPPLRQSFAKLLDGDMDKVEKALGIYRKYYSDKGIYDANPYEGIITSLKDLKESGYRMMVCTAKVQEYAERVIKHFEMDQYFQAIYGPGMDGTLDNKANLLAKLIADHGINKKQACLFGDRQYDMQAACKNSITPIAALWGFGSREELEESGAAYLCENTADIPELVKKKFPLA